MKIKTETEKVIINKRSGIFKLFSILMMSVFTLQFYILPSLSLTIEEQAGRKTAKPVFTENDEFQNKTQSRRTYPHGEEAKEPRLACLLSLIIPGGGQIYLKKDLKGIAFFTLTIIGYSAAGYYLYQALTAGDDSGSETKSKMIISGLLFLVGIVFHIVGIVEAYNDAIEVNEKKFYYGNNRSEGQYFADLIIE